MSEQFSEKEPQMPQPDPTTPTGGEAFAGGEASTQEPSPRQDPASPCPDDGWLEEMPALPRRPRTRLLTPLPLALMAVLLIACGFIGGVLVQKGQGSSSDTSGAGSAASFAARFAALRATASGSATTSGGGSSAAGSGTGGPSGFPGGFSRPTTGTVSYVSGKTIYLTNAEGNTVKVTTSPATTVSKTVRSDVAGIHPGETLAVSGSTSSSGAISAETIRVGAGEGGGLAALFGGGGSPSAGQAGGGSGSGGSSGPGPALFGSEGK